MVRMVVFGSGRFLLLLTSFMGTKQNRVSLGNWLLLCSLTFFLFYSVDWIHLTGFHDLLSFHLPSLHLSTNDVYLDIVYSCDLIQIYLDPFFLRFLDFLTNDANTKSGENSIQQHIQAH